MTYITGDVHYPLDSEKLLAINDILNKDDKLIVAGDMGVAWGNYEKTEANIKRLMSDVDYMILFCDGNHEHHPILNSYPTEEAFGGVVHELHPRLYHLMRGESYNIEGKDFLVFGGARSTDKIYRIENVDWFAEEEASATEIEHCLQTIDRKESYDYVITHAATADIERIIYYNDFYAPSLTSRFLNDLRQRITFKHWYCGHHHIDKEIDGLTLLYNRVMNIDTQKVIYTATGQVQSTRLKCR